MTRSTEQFGLSQAQYVAIRNSYRHPGIAPCNDIHAMEIDSRLALYEARDATNDFRSLHGAALDEDEKDYRFYHPLSDQAMAFSWAVERGMLL